MRRLCFPGGALPSLGKHRFRVQARNTLLSTAGRFLSVLNHFHSICLERHAFLNSALFLVKVVMHSNVGTQTASANHCLRRG